MRKNIIFLVCIGVFVGVVVYRAVSVVNTDINTGNTTTQSTTGKYIYTTLEFPEYDIFFRVPSIAMKQSSPDIVLSCEKNIELLKTNIADLKTNHPEEENHLADLQQTLDETTCIGDATVMKKTQGTTESREYDIIFTTNIDTIGNTLKVITTLKNIPSTTTFEDITKTYYDQSTNKTITRTFISGDVAGIGNNLQTLLENGKATVMATSGQYFIRLDSNPTQYYEISLGEPTLRAKGEIVMDVYGVDGEVSVLDQFKTSNALRDETQAEKMMKDGLLGESAENAVVPLVFHKDGSLYTAEEYNNSYASTTDVIEGFYTDLQTFSTITKIPEANGDYATKMPFGDGKGVWLFAPYVKYFQKSSL